MFHPEELELLSKTCTESWQLGDVIINMELAKSQGKEYTWGYSREVERLLIHGILHLLGYDHEKGKKEAQKMQRLERYLLAK